MRRIGSAAIWGACLLVIGAEKPSADADKPKQEAFTAGQLLGRMAKVYANCKSYRDAGIVKTVFFEANGKRTMTKPFTTSFARPDRFRFEYQEKRGDGPDEVNRYIVWRKGNEVQTWWDIKLGVAKPESLRLGLAGATGVSGGSALAIPALLLPDEMGGGLTYMREAKRMQDVQLEKRECFRVQGKYGASPTILWIDKETFLLRKIDTQMLLQVKNIRVEQTTTYDPVLDGEITDKMLEFDPPKQK